MTERKHREIGVIKWFDKNKGFGVISRLSDPVDIFVHQSQVKSSLSSLNEGAFVTYEYIEEPKEQALEVLLFRDDNDPNVLRAAFLSNRNGLWQSGLKRYLPSLSNYDEEIIEALKNKLKVERNKEEIAKYIPEQLMVCNDAFRELLPVDKQITATVALFEKAEDEEPRMKYKAELLELLRPFAHENHHVWDMIPDRLLSITDIRRVAPSKKLFSFYLDKFRTDSTKDCLEVLTAFLKQNRAYINDVPADLLREYTELFQLLPSSKQVEIIWEVIGDKWKLLSREAKILAIYKCAKENTKYQEVTNKLRDQQETDLLIRALLLILVNKEHKDHFIYRNVNVFSKAHENILEFVIRQSELLATESLLHDVLPGCSHGLTIFCEGRRWPEYKGNKEGYKSDEFGNEIAFCPRRGGPCTVHDRGARIFSNSKQHWSKWNIAELMEVCEVSPELDELQSNDIYTLKLSGWVNRIIEIQKRMSCSHCGETMISDIRYAKNLARYNSTVAKCNHEHETVYLTHCWACHQIIDSRESRHKKDKYYICIHCGSGPQSDSAFVQGDICPECASPHMQTVNYGVKECGQCFHRIKLPAGMKGASLEEMKKEWFF